MGNRFEDKGYRSRQRRLRLDRQREPGMKTLDDSLFTLPPGTFSQIIESDRGFHIVPVLERKDAGRTSFVDAKGEIKKKEPKDETVKKQINKYLDDVRQKTPVRDDVRQRSGRL